MVGELEKVADSQDAARTSLRSALDGLPAPLRELGRTPAIAAAMTDCAGDYGATADVLALSALDEDDSFPGAQRVFPDGYGQLADRLAEGLPVRLNTPVTAVSLRDPDHVVVETAGGSWTADKVIATVPLGVLKSGTIRFRVTGRPALMALGGGAAAAAAEDMTVERQSAAAAYLLRAV